MACGIELGKAHILRSVMRNEKTHLESIRILDSAGGSSGGTLRMADPGGHGRLCRDHHQAVAVSAGHRVPYLLWTAFAAYLNAGVWRLN